MSAPVGTGMGANPSDGIAGGLGPVRTQPDAKEDRASSVVPPVSPRMPWRVAEAQVLPEFRLRIRFLDGLEGIVDMNRLIGSADAGVFKALADPAMFQRAAVEHGAVTWPGDLDLAPDAMYRAIAADGGWTP